ncbi:hypothetical protein SDC9_170290 [bioreactor metagenome]|uniref:Uncharacterized protein n=1 Tax=bioreactor metagenome TaxID=1076179 RepID=A0A645G8E3_9ZZZZ
MGGGWPVGWHWSVAWCRAGGRTAVHRLPDGCGCDGQHAPGDPPHHRQHDGADGDGRRRKAELCDQHAPQRRKHHAAHAGSVVGFGQRHGPPALEPRRDHGVDARSAHCHPARTGQHGGGKELPMFTCRSPADHTHGQHAGPRHGDARHAVARMQAR